MAARLLVRLRALSRRVRRAGVRASHVTVAVAATLAWLVTTVDAFIGTLRGTSPLAHLGVHELGTGTGIWDRGAGVGSATLATAAFLAVLWPHASGRTHRWASATSVASLLLGVALIARGARTPLRGLVEQIDLARVGLGDLGGPGDPGGRGGLGVVDWTGAVTAAWVLAVGATWVAVRYLSAGEQRRRLAAGGVVLHGTGLDVPRPVRPSRDRPDRVVHAEWLLARAAESEQVWTWPVPAVRAVPVGQAGAAGFVRPAAPVQASVARSLDALGGEPVSAPAPSLARL